MKRVFRKEPSAYYSETSGTSNACLLTSETKHSAATENNFKILRLIIPQPIDGYEFNA